MLPTISQLKLAIWSCFRCLPFFGTSSSNWSVSPGLLATTAPWWQWSWCSHSWWFLPLGLQAESGTYFWMKKWGTWDEDMRSQLGRNWRFLKLTILDSRQTSQEHQQQLKFSLVGGLEHFLFSHILGIIIPIDFHIFQRGGPTTNQFWMSPLLMMPSDDTTLLLAQGAPLVLLARHPRRDEDVHPPRLKIGPDVGPQNQDIQMMMLARSHLWYQHVPTLMEVNGRKHESTKQFMANSLNLFLKHHEIP